MQKVIFLNFCLNLLEIICVIYYNLLVFYFNLLKISRLSIICVICVLQFISISINFFYETRASAFKKVSSTTTLASISMRDLIRELQNVTACLRAHELGAPGLESPRATEVSFGRVYLDRATSAAEKEERDSMRRTRERERESRQKYIFGDRRRKRAPCPAISLHLYFETRDQM